MADILVQLTIILHLLDSEADNMILNSKVPIKLENLSEMTQLDSQPLIELTSEDLTENTAQESENSTTDK